MGSRKIEIDPKRRDEASQKVAIPFAIRPSQEIIPHASPRAINRLKLGDSDWNRLDKALGMPLTPQTRELVEVAISVFVFSVLYRDEIPASRDYEIAMHDCVGRILDDLAGPCEALSHELTSDPVLSPWVHLRFIMNERCPEALSGLKMLQRELQKLKSEITDAGLVTRGARGRYELEPLYANLVAAAFSQGHNLRVNSYNDRGEHEKHPDAQLNRFVLEVLDVVKEKQAEHLATYSVPPSKIAAARVRFSTLLDKRESRLSEKLVGYRAELEGRKRSSRNNKTE